MEKYNLTSHSENALKKWVTLSDELRTLYAESDTFEPLKEYFDKHFTYSEVQLEYVKKAFLKSR